MLVRAPAGPSSPGRGRSTGLPPPNAPYRIAEEPANSISATAPAPIFASAPATPRAPNRDSRGPPTSARTTRRPAGAAPSRHQSSSSSSRCRRFRRASMRRERTDTGSIPRTRRRAWCRRIEPIHEHQRFALRAPQGRHRGEDGEPVLESRELVALGCSERDRPSRPYRQPAQALPVQVQRCPEQVPLGRVHRPDPTPSLEDAREGLLSEIPRPRRGCRSAATTPEPGVRTGHGRTRRSPRGVSGSPPSAASPLMNPTTGSSVGSSVRSEGGSGIVAALVR